MAKNKFLKCQWSTMSCQDGPGGGQGVVILEFCRSCEEKRTASSDIVVSSLDPCFPKSSN